MVLLVALAVAAVTVQSAVRTGAQTTPRTATASVELPLRVALYGDSIAWEIADIVEFLLNTARPVEFDHNAFGGTNACDWFDEAAADADAFDPDVVISLFTGNALTTCMLAGGDLSRSEIADKTAIDSGTLVHLFPAAVRYHVSTPRTAAGQARLDSGGVSVVDRISALLSAAATPTTHHVELGPLLYSNGRFASMLPCASFDPGCDGTQSVRVRAPDGVHLCPTVAPGMTTEAGVLPAPCPVHSSGALRLALGLVDFVLNTYPPSPITVIDGPADLGGYFGRPQRGASAPVG